MNLEERVERLEEFIGNIDAIKVYASTLQGLIDRYLTPLYIDANTSGSELLINDYLGDIDNIPHNVLFNIRATHDLDMTGADDATIRFKNGDKEVTFKLRRITSIADTDDDINDEGFVEKKLVNKSYTRGINYNIYIKSDDTAIISSNDTGIMAMEMANENTNAIKALQNFLANINKTVDDKGETTYTITDNVVVTGNLSTTTCDVTEEFKLNENSKPTVLPSGSTINGDASSFASDNAIPNIKYINDKISSEIEKYDSTKHLVGTTDGDVYLQDKEDGVIYFKLGE